MQHNYFISASSIIYLVVCLIVALLNAPNIKNLKHFSVTHKGDAAGSVLLGMYFVSVGSGFCLGYIEQMHSMGVIALVIVLCHTIQWHFTNSIFSRNISKFHGCRDIADVMKKLYGNTGLWLSVISTTLGTIGRVAAEIILMSFLCQYFFYLDATQALCVSAVIIMLYSIAGGHKAVLLTDIAQITMFFSVIALGSYFLVKNFAKSRDFFDAVMPQKLWIIPQDSHSALILLGLILYGLLPIGHSAPFLNRLLAMEKEKKLSNILTSISVIDCCLVFTLSALALFAVKTIGDGQLNTSAIIQIAEYYFNGPVLPLVALGLFATAISSSDSWLNANALIISKLCQEKSIRIAKYPIFIARVSIIIVCFISFIVAACSSSILTAFLPAITISESIIFLPIVTGFLGYKFQKSDVLRATGFALLFICAATFFEGKVGFVALFAGITGSFVGLTMFERLNISLKKMHFSTSSSGYLLAKLFGIALVYCIGHLYIEPVWSVGELLCLSAMLMIAAVVIITLHKGQNNTIVKNLIILIGLSILTATISSAIRIATATPLLYATATLCFFLLYSNYALVLCSIGLSVLLTTRTNALYIETISAIELVALTYAILLVFMSVVMLYLKSTVDETSEKLKEAYKKLQATSSRLEATELLANVDAISGLNNKRYLDVRLPQIIEESLKREKNFSLIILNIINFNFIRATYGESTCDDVLRSIGKIIRSMARPGDICARCEGLGFVLILDGVDEKEAKNIISRLQSAIEGYSLQIYKDPYELHCSISSSILSFWSSDNEKLLDFYRNYKLELKKYSPENNQDTSIFLEKKSGMQKKLFEQSEMYAVEMLKQAEKQKERM